MVFYYYGTFKALGKLLSSQEHLIDNMGDNEIKGMFIGWQGYVLSYAGEYIKAETFLKKALDIGTRINNKRIMGYVCSWLSWVCGDLGFFKKGIEYGERANKIAKEFKQDHYIYFKSLGGIGISYYWMGYASKCIKIGEKLIKYGNRHSQIRSAAMGYHIKGSGYVCFGNINKSEAFGEQAVAVSADPFYKFIFSLEVIFASILNNDLKRVDESLHKALSFFKKNGDQWNGDIAVALNCIVLIKKGRMTEGLNIGKKMEQAFILQHRKSMVTMVRLTLGKIYLEIIQKTEPISILTMIKNIGFIIQNVPTVYKKAIYWYSKTIEMAEEIGAIGIKAQALLDLGILYRIKKQNDKAKQSLETAIEIFEEVGAYAFLKQAKKELNQLNQ